MLNERQLRGGRSNARPHTCSDDVRLELHIAEGHGRGLEEPPPPRKARGTLSLHVTEVREMKTEAVALCPVGSILSYPSGNVCWQIEREMSGWQGYDLCGPHLSRRAHLTSDTRTEGQRQRCAR